MQLEDNFGTIDTVIEKFRKERLLDDLEVMQRAVKFEGNTLEYASTALKLQRELVALAVENNGEALQFAGCELRDDKDMVTLAVQKNGKAIRFASNRLKADSDVILDAVAQDAAALEHSILDSDSLIAVMEQHPMAIEYVPDTMYDEALNIAKLAAQAMTLDEQNAFQSINKKAEAKRIENRTKKAVQEFNTSDSRAEGKRDFVKLVQEIAPNLAQQRLRKSLKLMCGALQMALRSSPDTLSTVQGVIRLAWSASTQEERLDYKDVFLDSKLQVPEEVRELFPKEIYAPAPAAGDTILISKRKAARTVSTVRGSTSLISEHR